jgi:hypothetical protein
VTLVLNGGHALPGSGGTCSDTSDHGVGDIETGQSERTANPETGGDGSAVDDGTASQKAHSGSYPLQCSEDGVSSGDVDPESEPPPCSEDGGNSGDADPGSDPPLGSQDSGKSRDADPGSDPPPCSEDSGSSRDVDLGPDPPLGSEDSGNSGDADPGSDPPPRSEDSGNPEHGGDNDDTDHGHSGVLTSTGKSPLISFGFPFFPSPSLHTSAVKYTGA